MKIVIDIDENVFTRLFDNGIEDYAIANDDLFAIAKAIRNGTPIESCKDSISRKEVYDVLRNLGLGYEENGADEYMEGLWDAYNAIKSLPSVMPKAESEE